MSSNSSTTTRSTTELSQKITTKINSIPKLLLIVVFGLLALSARSSLDYFGVTPYLIAFILGALWMFTTSIFLFVFYAFMAQDAPVESPEQTGPDVTMGVNLYHRIHAKNTLAAHIAERDKTAEVRLKGHVTLQLEGSASDATRIPCEFRGTTLFVTNLNGNPNVQAIVIEGSYMRQVDEKTIEIIHPSRSLWQKEDYIYLRFNSSEKRQYWQQALSLVCKRYSDIYNSPEHYEGNNEMMITFNSLIKEYENAILKDPLVGHQGSTIVNTFLHRSWINFTNSKDIKKAILDKLIEKIDVKLTFAAEAGKAERIREISIMDLDLGTRVPFFKEVRVEPADTDQQNRDFILRTHVAYVDGNATIGIRIDVKHNLPFLPQIINIVVLIKHVELDLKIIGVAHPMKRFDIRIVEHPLVDIDLLESGGDLVKLRRVPGWEAFGRDKIRKLINEAIEEKICEVLLEPERQYVNMPGVDSDEESDSECAVRRSQSGTGDSECHDTEGSFTRTSVRPVKQKNKSEKISKKSNGRDRPIKKSQSNSVELHDMNYRTSATEESTHNESSSEETSLKSHRGPPTVRVSNKEGSSSGGKSKCNLTSLLSRECS